MAPLSKVFLSVLFVAVGMWHSSALPPKQDVPNAFSTIPYPRSIFIWWRPYQTILAEETASRIRSHLDRLPADRASPLELDTFLHENIKKAFLYPVLAGEGDKGASVLRGMLDEYSDGNKLDDRWLLIVFALGCSDSDQAVPALRRELRRIQDMFAGTDRRTTVDAKLPVIDALAIALARRKALTYMEIESLSNADPERAGAVLLLALTYAHRWMTKEQFLHIIHEALHHIGDESILHSLDSGGQQTGHLRAVRDYLLASPHAWPMARQAVLNANGLEQRAYDFILVTYLLVLTHQANGSQGVYDLDRAVVDRYLRIDLSRYPQASFAARILLHCAPSSRVAGWDQYIETLASHIRAKDVEMADYLGRDARQMTPEKEQLYDSDKVPPRMQKPGIYLYGFRRAGGMMHGHDVGDKDE